MPNYSTSSTDEINTTLTGNAGVTPIGRFNQGAFRTNLAKRITRPGPDNASIAVANGRTISRAGRVVETITYSNGYCNGVAMDWLRRMLLTPANRITADKANYKYDSIKRALPRDDVFGDGAAALDGTRSRAYASAQRMGKAYHEMNSLSYSRTGTGPWKIKDEAWRASAQSIDEDFAASRRTDGRNPTNSKQFANLVLVDSLSDVYQRPGRWMAQLVGAIPAATGAKVGFNRPGHSGHAVAIWRRGNATGTNDAYYFLDPNLGVYSANQTGLEWILQVLFWQDDEDTPFYNTCTSLAGTEMDYIIWRSR